MSDRRLICEAAFGFGPFDTIAATNWVELVEAGKPRLRAADWSIGRDNELDHFPPGTATVLLSNRDRHLDPDNAASPHDGFLLPNVPVRLRSTQPPFTVVSWARDTGIVFIDLVPGRRPAIGDVVVVDVADATFDGTFTVTGHFGTTTITYGQAGSNVTTTFGAGTVTEYADEFYGFVRGGWEQQLAPQGTGDCRLELVDLLGVMGGYTLPDVFTWQLKQITGLVAMWDLNEANAAEQIPDVSGFDHDGRVVGPVQFGQPGIAAGHPGSALFEAQSTAFPDRERAFIDFGKSPLLDQLSLNTSSVVATIRRRTAPANFGVVYIQGDGNSEVGSNLRFFGVSLRVLANGKIEYFAKTAGVAAITRQHQTPIGSSGHLVIATGAGIGLDSATLDTTSAGITQGNVNGAFIGGSHGLDPTTHWDGWIGTVAIYDTDMSLSDRQAVVAAYSKLSGQTSNNHIAWALDRLGVPAGSRNLDVGTVIMGTADTDGVDALQWMRDVTSTEGGGLYVDHRDGGKVRFRNRYHRHLSSRSVTSQATFTDDPAASPVAQIRYPPEGLDIAPNGIDGIINQTQVTWRDGTVLVEDVASIAAYGPRPRQLDTQATTANQARSAGEWVIANYAQPRSRIRGATASDGTFADRHDKVQALRVDDRVTFRVHPQKLGTATTVTLFVDGISHSCAGVEWRTSFRYAPGNTFTPWIWGTSAWNTTAFWG